MAEFLTPEKLAAELDAYVRARFEDTVAEYVGIEVRLSSNAAFVARLTADLRAARDAGFEEAARVAADMGFDAVAARIRALKGNDHG